MFGIYRLTRQKVFAGVLAGIAYRFSLNVRHLRLLYILFALFFFPAAVVIYVGLSIILPKDYADEKRRILKAKKVSQRDWSRF